MTYFYDTASAAAETGWYRRELQQERAEREADAREQAAKERALAMVADAEALADNVFADVGIARAVNQRAPRVIAEFIARLERAGQLPEEVREVCAEAMMEAA